MQNPLNLRVSGEAEELAVLVYAFTRAFPSGERFGLTSQMRRAAVSVGSNIFEGCGRQNDRSLIAFLYIAHGSTAELQFQLRLARRLEIGDLAVAPKLEQALTGARRKISKLIRELERKPSNS